MSEVFELRQYTLHPGQRDVLIELFDRELVETQEATGMRILGQFRDLDNPDRFVWLRSFPDIPSRAAALTAFYGGPVWRTHRDAANATMIDVDNVLLLRPAAPGFVLGAATRDVPATSLVVAGIHYLPGPVDDDLLARFDQEMVPLLEKAGARPLARLRTEYAENNFPALPVRTGEHTLVWLASFPSRDHYADHADLLDPAVPSTRREHLLLAPTPRSLLR